MDYAKEHKKDVTDAFRRFGMLRPDCEAPKPSSVETGAAGKSTVYIVKIPAHLHGSGRGQEADRAIKFTSHNRLQKERERTESLNAGNVGAAFLRPQHFWPEEGELRLSIAPCPVLKEGEEFTTLRQLLTDALKSHAVGPAVEALRQVLEMLKQFHGVPLAPSSIGWEDLPHSDATGLCVLESTLLNDCRDLFPQYSPASVLFLHPQHPCYPRAPLADTIALPASKRVLAHGDPNLTNFLTTTRRGQIRDVNCIDFADWTDGLPQAFDFARLEADLWHQILPELCDEAACISFVGGLRSYSDGWTTVPYDVSDARLSAFAEIVRSLREQAVGILSNLDDYLHMLCFHQLKALSWQNTRNEPTRARITYLGAWIGAQGFSKSPNFKTRQCPPTVRLSEWEKQLDARAQSLSAPARPVERASTVSSQVSDASAAPAEKFGRSSAHSSSVPTMSIASAVTASTSDHLPNGAKKSQGLLLWVVGSGTLVLCAIAGIWAILHPEPILMGRPLSVAQPSPTSPSPSLAAPNGTPATANTPSTSPSSARPIASASPPPPIPPGPKSGPNIGPSFGAYKGKTSKPQNK